ncbi:MAG: DUF1800 family protein [Chthoniobacteraceae bacterium]
MTDAQLADPVWLNQDSDGDGIKNKDEIAAGTNPFDPGSVVRITTIAPDTSIPANVKITFATELGKQYIVQGAVVLPPPLPAATTFTSISGATWNGTGGSKTLSVAKGGNNFFRILVQDMDTDNDGVGDWAENVVTLNSGSAQTVSGTNDYDYIVGQLFVGGTAGTPRQNLVTISATNSFASEDGPQAGTMTVSRTINLFPMTVNYGVDGTAVAGTDYSSIGSSVSFTAHGAASQDIPVNPLVQPTVKGSRSVTATLSAPGAGQPFALGSQTAATVIINPSTVASGTGLLGRYYDTASTTYADAANFGQTGMYVFTRSASPTTNGTAVVTCIGSTIPGLAVGSQVKLAFTSGNANLNNATFNNLVYPVTAVTASTFTVAITSASSFSGLTATNGNCNFSIQSFTHPAVVERLDSTVNFDWQYGTPNGVVISPNNSPDNYSASWECYLSPSTAGNYIFQLDADDKAEVLLDTGAGLVQIVEHNWNTPGADAVGTFKKSAAIALVVPASPAQRYRMVVHHVETTGDARCRLQWNVNGGTFANIPQANQFTHTQALAYTYTGGNVIIAASLGHSFSVGNTVPLSFTSGALFTPGIASTYNGSYTVAAVGGTGAAVTISAAVTTAGSNTITVPSTAGLAVGMGVTGTGLPGNEYITAIGAGTITVTTGTGVSAQGSTTLTATSNFTVAIAPSAQTTIPGATTVLNSSTITVPSVAGLTLGMLVSGTGLPANEFITAIGTTTITVTTGTGVTAQASTNLTATLNGFAIPVSSAVTTVGSPVITVPSVAGLAVGMAVSGTGLPANEFITAIVAGTGTSPGLISVTTGTGVTAQASTTITATLPATSTGSVFGLNISASATTGLYNLCYPNTAFAGSPGRIGIDATLTGGNNGIWNTGTPDATKIQPDTFSVRWTGQVQPQFSEEYTFVVQADDGCALTINGQAQVLKMVPSVLTGGSTYTYDSTTGDLVINYAGLAVPAGNYSVGETVRIDPSSSNLNHAPTVSPTYDYNPTSGVMTVDYTNLVVGSPGGTRTAASYAIGETVELDPVSGGLGNLNQLPYTITAVSGNTFSVNVGAINFTPTILVSSISAANPCEITTAVNHGLVTGTQVRIAGITTGTFVPAVNGLYTITVTAANKFTVASACTSAPTVGTGTVNANGNITVSDNRNVVINAIQATGTGTYNYVSGTGDATIDYSALGLAANTFQAGQKVALDPTSGSLSGLASTFYTVAAPVTATTFTVNFGTTFTTGSGSIAIITPSGVSVPAGGTTAFTVNIGAGDYANNSTGSINLDIINKSLKDWSSNGNERYVRIPMIGGTRYDIQLDAYESALAARCLLSWFSPSQPKQIIPSERLYPSNLPGAQIAKPAQTSPTDAEALVNAPFSYAVSGSNGGTVTVSGNPAWLTYSGGVLSGTPPVGAAGDYQILITITNAVGTSTSVLNLHVDAPTGSVEREYWTGVLGTTVASIPTATTPSGTANLTSLAGPTDFGDNYGARIRGYLTAPTTGNYYFWISANNAAELWIANDSEPVNAFKRAWVTVGSATPQTWNVESTQKSPWLALEAGHKYYFEVLHKAGVGSGDNVAVGWAKPGESTAAPSQVVPGYALSPYVAPAPGSTPGTLYLASMLAQSPAVSNGVGSSTLRLSEDENTAYMKFSHSGLVRTTAPVNSITSKHIHADPYLTHPTAIIYDIDTPATPGDGLITDASNPYYGFYKWTLVAVGGLSKADIIEIIKEGKAYINLHTTDYPNGEIRGNYTLAGGTRTFTAPPPPPSLTDDSDTTAGAARFLAQASFGANIADIVALKAIVPAGGKTRYEMWIDDQFNTASKPQTLLLPEVLAREIGDVFGPFDVRVAFNTWWKTSMSGQDQLRQRVAYALSQIHVVSGQGPLEDNSRALAYFYDTLGANAFGNFRDILIGTTLTPTMGRYLDMLGNDKPDLSIGRSPNENYAREIKQLFSIGLYRMWPDGTLMLTSQDAPIETYTQREIVGLAHVFSGWYYGYSGPFLSSFSAPTDWTRPMREVPARHFTGTKRILNNEVLPGLTTVAGQTLDPYANHLSISYNDPVYQALPGLELNAVHDMLFNHPNTGPFICRQLIQRLVTSSPSRDYLYRVVQKFNDNGSGVRGDMKAVLKAILLDYEARSTDLLAIPAYGKQREPVLRVANAARAFRPSNVGGSYAQTVATLFTGSVNGVNYFGAPAITITTTTPHLLAAGNSVFLEFTDATAGGAPAPTTGNYTVLSVTDATHYTIPAPGWLSGTYAQSLSTVTVTMSGHWLPGDNANVIPTGQILPAANKGRAYFDFTSGGLAGTAMDQAVQTVVTSNSYDIASGVGNTATAPSINGNASGSTFTFTASDSATRNGNVAITRFPGSYSCTGRNGIITIDTSYGGAGSYGQQADHGLSVGDTVFLNFTNSRDTSSGVETSTENDLVYTIASVPDPNTFTVQARDFPNAAMNSDNQVVIYPLKAQPLVRNGTLVSRQSTYNLDNTDTDLQQTPLNSTTVFNYFLPEFKFAGTLASQGITTPEFQLTSETTVIRQANFMYAGIFNPGNTNGISSFKSGTNALVMDFTPWMAATATDLGLGAPTNLTVPWTHNQNLGVLVDQLGTLVTAGQLSSSAKTLIKNFVSTPIFSIAPGTAPATSPCLVTTVGNHYLNTGDNVLISGMTASGTFSPANPFTSNTIARTITKVSNTTFTVTGVTCTAAPTAGSLTSAHASVIQYNQGTTVPSDTNKRDRLRAIIHLILTSPDFTIQR